MFEVRLNQRRQDGDRWQKARRHETRVPQSNIEHLKVESPITALENSVEVDLLS
jgi:hypothetical protein